MYFVYLASPGLAGQLTARALQRLQSAFRPSTTNAYSRMWRDFLAFLAVSGLHISQVTHLTILAFMEFLSLNAFSPANIANYLAGIRAQCIIHGLDTTPFRHDQILLMHRSLKLNAPFTPRTTCLVTIEMLHQILKITETMPNPEVFTALYTFCFFSFMRLSNILPHSTKAFDLSRQLARGDIFLGPQVATVLVKWSKTMQDRKTVTTITIPNLGASPLCPVTALGALLKIQPGSENQPLFQLKRIHQWVPLTDSVARKHLKQISQRLNQSPSITFHDFRRSGTTWAFEHGVPLEKIKAQGTWKSDTVWTYITSNAAASACVSSTFQQHLLQ